MEPHAMMWKVLNNVVTMNNECVEQLHDGNLMEGLFVLQRAVSVVRDAAAMLKLSPSPEAPALRNDVILSQFGFKPRDRSLSLPKHAPTGENESMHDRPLFLYLAKGSCEGSQNARHCNTEEEHSILFTLFSAAILFNLALVCHRLGKMFGRDSSSIRASKLYMVIVELLNDSSSLSSTMEDGLSTTCHTSSTHLVLLTLALNNLGHVQYELCNYPGYHRCMITLKNLMSKQKMINDFNQFLDNPTATGSDCPMIAGIMDEIRLNIMFWHFSPPSVAHAA